MRSRVLILASFVIALFGGVTIAAHAAYNASDLLGQFDDNDLPSWTSSGANNTPNGKGLRDPRGLFVDPINHRLFVAEYSGGERLRVFNLDASNAIADRVSDYVIGTPNVKTVGCGVQGATGTCGTHSVVYDDATKLLFVSDYWLNRVLVFNLSSGVSDGMAATYVLGQPGFTTTGATTTQTGMFAPLGLAYDSVLKRLFAVDENNNRVLVYDLSSGVSSGMAATYVLGQSTFTTSTAGTADNKFNLPLDVAYDSVRQRLFVPEFSNNRVLVFDVSTSSIANGMSASWVLGQATFASSSGAVGQARLSQPFGVSVDEARNWLFVADSANNRVVIYDLSGGITNGMNAANVLGQATFASSTASTTQSRLSGPKGVFYEPGTQRLYVSDSVNHRIMVFDAAAITDGEDAVDALGHLDRNNNVLYTKNSANDASTLRGMSNPFFPVVDTVRHRLFVNHQAVGTGGSSVTVYNMDASNNLLDRLADNILGQADFYGTLFTVTTHNTRNPQGLAYDDVHDRLFVVGSSDQRVLVFNTATITDDMNADYVLGQSLFTTITAATTQSGVRGVVGVAYDRANDRLFVSDMSNNRVLVFDTASGTIANGMNASFVLGQPTFTASSSATTQDGLSSPRGLIYDAASGRLFVADRNNHRIMVFDAAPGTIANGMNASFVLGQPTFTSSSSPTSQSGMADSFGVAYDPVAQRLFASEPVANRVLVFDLSGGITNGMNASAIFGQADFTSTAAAITQSGTRDPLGLAYDSGNRRLYVGGSSVTNRVMIFTLFNISTPSLPSGLTDEAYSQTLSASNAPGTLSWSVASGTLPPGLTFSSSGVLSGRPTPGTSGSYTFTVQATDVAGGSLLYDRKSYTVNIGMPAGGSTTVTPPPAASGGGTGNTTSTTAVASSTSAYPGSEPSPKECAPYITKYVRYGAENDPDTVKKLQSFLRDREGFSDLAITGVYAQADLAAVVKFQEKYADRILTPWGEAKGTGLVYLTTAQKMNEIVCATSPGMIDPATLIPYSKLFSTSGVVPPAPSTPPTPSLPAPAAGKTLSLGMQGPVVKQLQAWLNQNGFPLAQTGPGSPGQETDRFGALTWKAVARFQEAYASEVLVPVGLSRGSGIVGPRTWAKLEALGFK